MTESVREFQIEVRSSPQTNDHEVRLLADGEDLIQHFCSDMMGLDPSDLLVEPCPLLVETDNHTAMIGRCYCGVVGCGSVEVKIHRDHDQVVWQSLHSDAKVQFRASQYQAEIERALRDFSWEAPERMAARLIANAVDTKALEHSGFLFDWASGRCKEGFMTVSLTLNPGPYQILVKLPWDGKAVDDIVARFKLQLAEAPESWQGVECFPLAQNLGLPPIRGLGWRL